MRDDSVRIDELDARLSGRIDDLDTRMSGRFDALDARMDGVDDKINRVEARLDAKIDGVDRSLRVQIEDLRDQIRFVAEVQSVHGEKLDRVASDVDVLKTGVSELKIHVFVLETDMREVKAGLRGINAQIQDLTGFVKRVADNHERRLTALDGGVTN